MKVSFYMLLYRAFHAQRKCLRPFMAELGLAPGQPKVLLVPGRPRWLYAEGRRGAL